MFQMYVVLLALNEPNLTDKESEILQDIKFSIAKLLPNGFNFIYEAI
jgi:hypothetical protein